HVRGRPCLVSATAISFACWSFSAISVAKKMSSPIDIVQLYLFTAALPSQPNAAIVGEWASPFNVAEPGREGLADRTSRWASFGRRSKANPSGAQPRSSRDVRLLRSPLVDGSSTPFKEDRHLTIAVRARSADGHDSFQGHACIAGGSHVYFRRFTR